ncbi:hypothetical protein Tsp_09011 [Trichinella spiralis]|uniref:hypothetical protein n=1 Tax=Trichinella spiralis TaxID=6334 RepID=UPI0001EFC563|nr:hypothetical protein Tsp_09011 [Trichinella spiralis]
MCTRINAHELRCIYTVLGSAPHADVSQTISIFAAEEMTQRTDVHHCQQLANSWKFLHTSCPHSGKMFEKLIIFIKNLESSASSFNLSTNSAPKRSSKNAMSTAP